MEYSNYLQHRLPGLKITSEENDAPAHLRALASMVSYAQMAGFAVAFFGTQMFAALSMPVPQWANYMQENKGTAIMGFFLGNMVISGLIAVLSLLFLPRSLHSSIHSPPRPLRYFFLLFPHPRFPFVPFLHPFTSPPPSLLSFSLCVHPTFSPSPSHALYSLSSRLLH